MTDDTRPFPIQTHPRFALNLRRGEPAPSCPSEIPWGMIAPHEKQAMHNHGQQTMARLAERGGLSPSEAVAVLEDRDWQPMRAEEACGQLSALVHKFQEEAGRLQEGP